MSAVLLTRITAAGLSVAAGAAGVAAGVAGAGAAAAAVAVGFGVVSAPPAITGPTLNAITAVISMGLSFIVLFSTFAQRVIVAVVMGI